jgi:flagellin-like hook-associated protein FlgL
MNKNELKKILKPLIKECIKEVIFEDGTLSTIISEVVKGTSSQSIVTESKTKIDNQKALEMQNKKLQERRKKMLDVIGKDSYNGVDLFEGTTPTTAPRNSSAPQGSKPLDGIDPRDPGVDISSFGASSNIWKKLAGN